MRGVGWDGVGAALQEGVWKVRLRSVGELMVSSVRAEVSSFVHVVCYPGYPS